MDDQIIVSLTSWTKRINLVPKVVESMLNQTLKPQAVEIVLSLEEFPRLNTLPNELLELATRSDVLLHFVKGNDGVFKKLIPTLKRHYSEDVLIATVDDDIMYSPRYLEVLYSKYLCHKSSKFCLAPIPDNGSRELHRCEDYDADLWEKLTPEIISYQLDDIYYRMYLEAHNKNVSHLSQKEYEKLPKGLMEETYIATPKLSDRYCINGKLNKMYVRDAINEIEKVWKH